VLDVNATPLAAGADSIIWLRVTDVICAEPLVLCSFLLATSCCALDDYESSMEWGGPEVRVNRDSG
jgi:hypothetical protein